MKKFTAGSLLSSLAAASLALFVLTPQAGAVQILNSFNTGGIEAYQSVPVTNYDALDPANNEGGALNLIVRLTDDGNCTFGNTTTTLGLGWISQQGKQILQNPLIRNFIDVLVRNALSGTPAGWGSTATFAVGYASTNYAYVGDASCNGTVGCIPGKGGNCCYIPKALTTTCLNIPLVGEACLNALIEPITFGTQPTGPYVFTYDYANTQLALCSRTGPPGGVDHGPYSDTNELHFELLMPNVYLPVVFNTPAGLYDTCDNSLNSGAPNGCTTSATYNCYPVNGTVALTHSTYDPATDSSNFVNAYGYAWLPLLDVGGGMKILAEHQMGGVPHVQLFGIKLQSLNLNVSFDLTLQQVTDNTLSRSPTCPGCTYSTPYQKGCTAIGSYTVCDWCDITEQVNQMLQFIDGQFNFSAQNLFTGIINSYFGPTGIDLSTTLQNFIANPFSYNATLYITSNPTDYIWYDAAIDSYDFQNGADTFFVDGAGVLMPWNMLINVEYYKGYPGSGTWSAPPYQVPYNTTAGQRAAYLFPSCVAPLAPTGSTWGAYEVVSDMSSLSANPSNPGFPTRATFYIPFVASAANYGAAGTAGAATRIPPQDLWCTGGSDPQFCANPPLFNYGGNTYMIGLGIHQNALSRALWKAATYGALCIWLDAATSFGGTATALLNTKTWNLFMPQLSKWTTTATKSMALEIAPKMATIADSPFMKVATYYSRQYDLADGNPRRVTNVSLFFAIPAMALNFYVNTNSGDTWPAAWARLFGLGIGVTGALGVEFTPCTDWGTNQHFGTTVTRYPGGPLITKCAASSWSCDNNPGYCSPTPGASGSRITAVSILLTAALDPYVWRFYSNESGAMNTVSANNPVPYGPIYPSLSTTITWTTLGTYGSVATQTLWCPTCNVNGNSTADTNPSRSSFWYHILGNIVPVLADGILDAYSGGNGFNIGIDLAAFLKANVTIDATHSFVGPGGADFDQGTTIPAQTLAPYGIPGGSYFRGIAGPSNAAPGYPLQGGDWLSIYLSLTGNFTANYIINLINTQLGGIPGFSSAPPDMLDGIHYYQAAPDASDPRVTITQMSEPLAERTVFQWAGESQGHADPRLLYTWRLDSGTWYPLSGDTSREFRYLLEGNHTFEVRSLALPDRTPSPISAVRFRVDSLPPDLGVSGSSVVHTYSPSFPLYAHDDQAPPDTLQVAYRVDGQDWSGWVPYLSNRSIRLSGLSAGQHSLEVRAKDDVGNVSRATKAFRVDSAYGAGCACRVAQAMPAGDAAANGLLLLLPFALVFVRRVRLY